MAPGLLFLTLGILILVCAAILVEELRVSAPSRDTLQEVVVFLRSNDYGLQLPFEKYR